MIINSYRITCSNVSKNQPLGGVRVSKDGVTYAQVYTTYSNALKRIRSDLRNKERIELVRQMLEAKISSNDVGAILRLPVTN